MPLVQYFLPVLNLNKINRILRGDRRLTGNIVLLSKVVTGFEEYS